MSKMEQSCRDGLHAEIDNWLDSIDANPLNAEDGETHEITINVVSAGYDDNNAFVVNFFVSRHVERNL